MKLQKAVKRETAHIALGVAVFTVLENIIYFLLGIWNTTVLGGSLVGAVLAIVNFFALALTVQAAAATGDEKRFLTAFACWWFCWHSLRCLPCRS